MAFLLRALMAFLDSQVLPHLLAARCDYVLRKRLEEQKAKTLILDDEDSVDDDVLTLVKEQSDGENERRKNVLEKAKAGLFIVGISVAFMFGSLTYASRQPELGTWEAILLTVSAAYMVASSITLTIAVNVKEQFGLYLDFYVKVTDTKINLTSMGRGEQLTELVHATKCNQLITNSIASYTSAGFTGIRNGLLAAAAFFVYRLFA